MINNKPQHGVQYALTGASGDKCILNGNTWEESRVSSEDMWLLKKCNGVHENVEEIIKCESCSVILK